MKITPLHKAHENHGSHVSIRLTRWIFLGVLFLGAPAVALAAAPALIDIAPGDGDQLEQEFASAWERGDTTTLRLAPGSTYHVGTLLPRMTQQTGKAGLDIHLQGRGARLIFDKTDQPSSADLLGIFLYPGERLRMSQMDIRIANATLGSFFDFRGDVALEDVSIIDSHLRGSSAAHLIAVRGSLHAVNLTIAGNQVETTLWPVHHLISASAPTASVVLENVTITDNWGIHRGTREPIGLNGEYVGGFSLSNSIVDSCRGSGAVNSLGGNLILDPACGVGPDDRRATHAGLMSAGQHGGLVSTYALSPISPAIGTGLMSSCAATDARGQVRHGHCDAGAYQFGVGGADAGLDRGGVNGTWYDAKGSGSLIVNRNNDRDVLLGWFGYDGERRQRWIYATLPFALSGESATAYVNDVVPSTPAGWPTAREAGRFEIEFSSCQQAHLKFDSTIADLPSFEVDLSRLTFTAQLGCVEPAQEED